MKDVEVQIPNIVICLNEPFKSDQYPKSLEDYYNITYSADEVFAFVPKDLEVTRIATWEGMCFLLKQSKESDETDYFIVFKINENLKVYFVDIGRELCLIYGLVLCDVPIDVAQTIGRGNDMVVSVTKFLHIPGYTPDEKLIKENLSTRFCPF